MPAPELNLIVAWVWILLGFISGLLLGLFFHDEKWLGGYASHKRRLYRLGHISFFGLGAVNLLFWLTARNLSAAGANLGWASGLFALGAVSMPLCCAIMAHRPRFNLIFAIPVLSLIAAGTLTLLEIVKL